MDPNTARFLLDCSLPLLRDLEPADAAALEARLTASPAMAEQLRRDRAADAAIATAMRDVPVPAGLRERIHLRLAEQRGAYYRRRFLQVGALAAALLLAILLGWDLRDRGRTPLNPEVIGALASAQMGADPDEVHRWLGKQDIHVPDPVPFNYHLLSSYGLADFQGKPVPTLLFLNHAERSFLRVHVVQGRQFDLKRIDQKPFSNGACTVEIRHDPRNPEVAFVLIYTGVLTNFLVPSETLTLT